MALLAKARVRAIYIRRREKLVAKLLPVNLSASSILLERVAATILVWIWVKNHFLPLLMLFVYLIRNFLDEPHSLNIMRENVAHKVPRVQILVGADLTEAHNLQNHVP